MDRDDFFIGVYTHQVKSYCDGIFFERLRHLSGNRPVHVVDNSPGDVYLPRLKHICGAFDRFRVSHVDVPVDPISTLFLRNVCASANALREAFLRSRADHLLIVESDVIPPADLIPRLAADIDTLPFEWGVLGAVYYRGRHDFALQGMQRSDLVFSGCTVYRRELLEKCSFRWCEEYPRSFPDAWMSTDAVENGFSLWTDYAIRCDHLNSHSERDLEVLLDSRASRISTR